uniref:Uncharacterized protein n=1 Tax=Rhizophora mucronata TaxID=61149 RepID=A0A2P2MNR3_RHIMU
MPDQRFRCTYQSYSMYLNIIPSWMLSSSFFWNIDHLYMAKRSFCKYVQIFMEANVSG